MNTYADAIKNLVPMDKALEMYGIVPERGKALCPFHREKTPSLVINRNNRAWKCYGCGEGGTVIDFVMKIDGIGFRQAIVKINSLFNLSLPLSRKMTARERDEQRKEMARRQEQRAAEDKKRLETESNYLDALVRLENAEKILKSPPKNPGDMTEDYIAALGAIDGLRYDFEYWDMKRGEPIGHGTDCAGLEL